MPRVMSHWPPSMRVVVASHSMQRTTLSSVPAWIWAIRWLRSCTTYRGETLAPTAICRIASGETRFTGSRAISAMTSARISSTSSPRVTSPRAALMSSIRRSLRPGSVARAGRSGLSSSSSALALAFALGLTGVLGASSSSKPGAISFFFSGVPPSGAGGTGGSCAKAGAAARASAMTAKRRTRPEV